MGAAVSSARTTVVPIAITRLPAACVAPTRRAVATGTSYCSANGGSWPSGEETPAWSVIGAISTPLATSWVISRRVNGRPALGIFALPGLIAYTF